MSGDLRAVLTDGLNFEPSASHLYTDDILAALAAADEPLVAEVEVPCEWCSGSGRAGGPKPDGLIGWSPCSQCKGNGGRTVTVVCVTEDVLRERLREALPIRQPISNERVVDAIVRAIVDGGS